MLYLLDTEWIVFIVEYLSFTRATV